MDADPVAMYHRTFAKFAAPSSWPREKHSRWDWGYRGEAYYERELAETYARSINVVPFYASQLTGGRINPAVRLMPKPDQTFWGYATKWELAYSCLILKPHTRVQPVVDETLAVVGHIGWWKATEVLIPKSQQPDIQLQAMVDDGVPVFASAVNPMPDAYRTNDFVGPASGQWCLMTSVDGSVEHVLDYSIGEKPLEPTLFPWEYVQLGLTAVEVGVAVTTLTRAGVSSSIRMIVKAGGRVRRVLAAGLRNDLAKAAQAQAYEVIMSKRIGRFGETGSILARVEVQNGQVIYRIDAINLRTGGQIASLEARRAHLELMKCAAQTAQQRGKAEFLVRGINANANFRASADRLVREAGVANSARTVAGSAPGFTTYEVKVQVQKMGPWIEKEVARMEQKAMALGGARGRGGGEGGGGDGGGGRGEGPKTLHGFPPPAPKPFKRIVGPLSPQEMSQYVQDIVKRRPDLQHLMRVRNMRGKALADEVNAALRKFETMERWTVKEKTVQEMRTVTPEPDNLVVLRAEQKELWINKDWAAQHSPETFYRETVHDLCAHALAGRGSGMGAGLQPGIDLPFVPPKASRMGDGLLILEKSILDGDFAWIVRELSKL